jgi:hypothetical protein
MMSVASLDYSYTPSQPRRSEKKHFLAHAVIIALAAIMLYPALWMISSSFKPSQSIFSEPGLWPRDATLDNWAQGWIALGIPFWRFFLNSAVIAVLSVTRFHRNLELGRHVRDVRALAHSAVPGVFVRSEAPGAGHRHHRSEIAHSQFLL